MLYWMLWMKVPIEKVQMGLALKILGAKPDLHHPNSPTDGAVNANEFELEGGQGEKGIEIAPRRRSFGDAQIVPDNGRETNEIMPFNSLKSVPQISPSESLSAVDTNIEGNPFVPPLSETAGAGASTGKDEENERIWKTSIWELITDSDNSLDPMTTQLKMTSLGLGSLAEIRYMNEQDIELIGATMKAVPRRKLRFLWGGRLVKTQAYLQVPGPHDIEDYDSKMEEAEGDPQGGVGTQALAAGDLLDLPQRGGESIV
jgi:hypothetical protein